MVIMMVMMTTRTMMTMVIMMIMIMLIILLMTTMMIMMSTTVTSLIRETPNLQIDMLFCQKERKIQIWKKRVIMIIDINKVNKQTQTLFDLQNFSYKS